MRWDYYGFPRYITAGERRARAARQLARLQKKLGRAPVPVVVEGRRIADTFWGKAWCDNLEAYSDFENRLPRGRSYLRDGAVLDLFIERGEVKALVCGTSLYTITIRIKPLLPSLWKDIQTECAGKIDSLVELLQGKLSAAVMEIVTRPGRGLFPAPREIDLDCSCPDWAELCKHVAACLYAVGARLDSRPELLFLLRGVDPSALISKESVAEALRQAPNQGSQPPTMTDADVAEVFGIDLQPTAPLTRPKPEASSPKKKKKRTTRPRGGKTRDRT